MKNLGGECVMAAEIDEFAIDTYKNNYNIDPACDVRELDVTKIPKYDVLCAGFPCQSFSKAGNRLGFEDEIKGTLFFEIVRILKHTKPKYILLENVRNLLTHDNGNTITVIKKSLDDLGYNIKIVVMSPHQLGIPQLRERVYITGIRKDIYSGELNITIPDSECTFDIFDSNIIDNYADDKYYISEHEERVLTCWDEFYNGIKEKVIGFPIWSFEFGQTYSLDEYPKWKADFCIKNRNLYLNNKEFIDKWLDKWNYLEDFTPTERKFEWQAGNSIKSIWDGFIQFRPSGIRVKRPTYFPTLVAIVQIPIIGRYKRRITPREAARLQSFPDDFIPNSNDRCSYKQFGNAVNVNCVEYLAKQLFSHADGKELLMEREQVFKSEQILPNMQMTVDYDQPICKPADILDVYKYALDDSCKIEKFNKTKNVYTYEHNGIKEYFLTSSITYLSNPHPIFKKRCQLKPWFKDFYKAHKNDANTNIRLMGIYHYEGLVVFVEFKLEDYIFRKLNSSAAHVYTNDIFQAVTHGVFEKIDCRGNHVTSVLGKNFKKYLDGNAGGNSVFDIFKSFNNKFSFNEWIFADDAIAEMKDASWYQWKGTEWPGWSLEYKFAAFVEENKCQDQIRYIGNLKDSNMLDFDLIFPKSNFYGDLKASDISKHEAPGNDQESVLDAIAKYGKLWYIIYEHETIKDSDMGNEMAKKRMKLLGEPYIEGGKISYASRMKHSVRFKRMRIFELNRVNMNQALSVFNQGHQPNGDARKAKFLINKQNIDNCIVFSYDA